MMGLEHQPASFAGGLRDVVCLIEDDDAVLQQFLVGFEHGFIEEVVVGHDEEIGEVSGHYWIEIWAKDLFSSYLLHYIYVQ